MATVHATATHARVPRALIFLAVVWSIGAAFLALEAGMTELSSFGASNLLSANIVLPRQSGAALAHCQEVIKGLPPASEDANISAQAWYMAWRLGFLLGSTDATLTAGIANRSAAENVLRQTLPVTNALRIPSLALPQHERSAYALREFSVFLEEDPPCVAAAFQLRNSPRHAALYKFGAAFGFATTYQRLAPKLEGVLAPELRLYGSAAGIPADLYAPKGQAVQSIVERTDAYIKGTH